MLCDMVAEANARRTGDRIGKVELETKVGGVADTLLQRQRS